MNIKNISSMDQIDAFTRDCIVALVQLQPEGEAVWIQLEERIRSNLLTVPERHLVANIVMNTIMRTWEASQ